MRPPTWRTELVASVALAVLAAAGCAGPEIERARREAVHSPEVILAAHNAWAESIGHVWSRADLTLVAPFEPDRPAKHDLAGHLFLAKPDRLFVHGQVLGQEVFQIGLGPEHYWLWIRPQVNTVWRGRRGGAGEGDLVVSPAALMETLGVHPIRPGPGERWEVRAYPRDDVVTEFHFATWTPRRRTWLDASTHRPRRIDLFDALGRQIVMNEVLAWQDAGGIALPSVYRARFTGDPEGEVDLVLGLRATRLDKPPNPKIFEPRVPPGAKVIDLDTPVP